MNEMNREDYKSVIFDGCAIECDGVSVCNLIDVKHWQTFVPKARYQVWSDRHSFNKLYFTLDDALDKFFDLCDN
jgi:hypothetical protein